MISILTLTSKSELTIKHIKEKLSENYDDNYYGK